MIESLLDDDTEQSFDLKNNMIDADRKQEKLTFKDYLQVPKKLIESKDGKIASYYSKERIAENKRISSVGSWGQFNSFFPIKAALRILANYMVDKNVFSVKLDDFVKVCLITFKQRNYYKKRGFPSSDKDTAKGRFVWHFLASAYEMGLIRVTYSDLKYDGLPASLQDWDTVEIELTNQGMEFALLPNNIFDSISEQQVLTNDEREWMISYLKKIDEKGYKEYSLLKDVYTFLAEGHNGKDELVDWFKNNSIFVDYIKSWSRKAQRGDEQALKEQINTLSASFASSKVALLRELVTLENRRNRYSIINKI